MGHKRGKAEEAQLDLSLAAVAGAGDVQLIVKLGVHMASIDYVSDPTTKLPVPSTPGLATQMG